MVCRDRTNVASAWTAWTASFGLLMAGCGGQPLPTYEAGGKVAFANGTPLRGGWVEFQPADTSHNVSARGEIQSDGTFRLGTFSPGDGAIEGEHRVLVVPPLPEGDRDETPIPRWIIDPKYFRFETSGLRFRVDRDESKNRFEIRVTPPGS